MIIAGNGDILVVITVMFVPSPVTTITQVSMT